MYHNSQIDACDTKKKKQIEASTLLFCTAHVYGLHFIFKWHTFYIIFTAKKRKCVHLPVHTEQAMLHRQAYA